MSKYGLDKFYTKPEIVKEILDGLDLTAYSTIIEPSAGNGSFSKQIECTAYDLEPEDDFIIQQDFLELDLSDAVKPLLVIGNPPFGRNGSLALKFINHAAKFADTIAFILPKSFKKDFFYYKIPLNFWRSMSIDLEPNSFIFDGDDFDTPCVFQIYVKRETLRIKPRNIYPTTFSFAKKEDANVAVRRVGVYAGKAFLDTEKSIESHYFINVDDPVGFVNRVNELEWEHNNTVGPRSISKPELINNIEGRL